MARDVLRALARAGAPCFVRSLLPHAQRRTLTADTRGMVVFCPLRLPCKQTLAKQLSCPKTCWAPPLGKPLLMRRAYLSGAHAQACDWGGDISFEEARWAQLQAVAAGRPPAALAAEMAAAAAAQNRLYQVRLAA